MTFLRKIDELNLDLNETVFLSAEPGAALRQPIQAEEAKEVSFFLWLWRWRRFLKTTPLRRFAGRNPCDYPLAIHIRNLDVSGVEKWRESCFAAWALGIAPLTTSVKQEVQRTLSDTLEDRMTSQSDALSRSLWRVAFQSYAFATLLLIPILYLSGYYQSLFHGDYWMAILILVSETLTGAALLSLPLYFPVLIVSRSAEYLRKRRIQFYAAVSLGRLGMPESVATLATATLNTQGDISRAACHSLMKVLPSVASDHFGLLSSKSVRDLCKLLTRHDNSITRPFALINGSKKRTIAVAKGRREIDRERDMLIILNALEHIGDSGALNPVNRLAEKSAFESVRARAASLVPILEERKRQENDRSMLLRGSAEPCSKAFLLRPAYLSIKTAPSELLRSASLRSDEQTDEEVLEASRGKQ